jgi:hypothetical protein
MPAFAINGESRVRPLAGKSNSLVIEPLDGGSPRLVITGFAGDPLPGVLHARERGVVESGDGRKRGRLRCREGEFAFEARAVERLESVTGLFEPLLADFSLRSRDRLMVRVLLRLLRWPGGAWLLRRWHVRRQ